MSHSVRWETWWEIHVGLDLIDYTRQSWVEFETKFKLKTCVCKLTTSSILIDIHFSINSWLHFEWFWPNYWTESFASTSNDFNCDSWLQPGDTLMNNHSSSCRGNKILSTRTLLKLLHFHTPAFSLWKNFDAESFAADESMNFHYDDSFLKLLGIHYRLKWVFSSYLAWNCRHCR